MKKLLLAALVLSCLGGPVLAGVNAGGTLIVHDANIEYTEGISDYCLQGTIPADCQSADIQIMTWANDVVWTVYAAFPGNSSPRLKEIAFGIEYLGMVVVHDSGPCAGTEIQDAGWPASGTGTHLIWDSAQTGRMVPVYWFAGYEYYGDPGLFRVTPHASLGGQFIDDSPEPVVDDITGYGQLGFNWDGSLPCPEQTPITGACCAPDGSCTMTTEADCSFGWHGNWTSCAPENPCEASPVEASTWGQIKNAYR